MRKNEKDFVNITDGQRAHAILSSSSKTHEGAQLGKDGEGARKGEGGKAVWQISARNALASTKC